MVCILYIEKDKICKRHLCCVLKDRVHVFLKGDFLELRVLNSVLNSLSAEERFFCFLVKVIN